MGFYESRLAVLLGHYIEDFLELHDIGFTLGEGGMMRFQIGQVRIPDVAFYSWNQFTDRLLPLEKILSAVPDLSVEILSEANTPAEMLRKRQEFFGGGATLFWIVDPGARTLEALRLDAGAGAWIEVGAYDDESTARIAPFEGIELEAGRLFPPP